MKMKKIISAVTALAMSISMFGVSVFAEDRLIDIEDQLNSGIAEITDEQLIERNDTSLQTYTSSIDFCSITETTDRMSTYGFAWYPNGNEALGYKQKTLVLSNFNLKLLSYPGSFAAITLPADSTILYSGENMISNACYFAAHAIVCKGKLTIKAIGDNSSLSMLAYNMENYNASRDKGTYMTLWVQGDLTIDGSGFSDTMVNVGSGGPNTSGKNSSVVVEGNITVTGNASLICVQLSPYAAYPAIVTTKNIYIMDGGLGIASKGYTYNGCIVTGEGYYLYAQKCSNVSSLYFENGKSKKSTISAKERGVNVLFLTVATPVEKFVDRLYSTMLGRNSEYDGRTNWVRQLNNGISAAQVSSGFVLSEELKNQNISNGEFVDRMYRTFLGRDADGAGKADWVNALDNGCSYAFILNSFAGSSEFNELCAKYGITSGSYRSTEPRDQNRSLTAFVSRMYTKALGRSYDVDGLNNWTGAYLRGEHDASGIAYGFIFSDEFKLKNLNDNDYVEVLYQTFFNRASDPEGKAGWLNKLANGYTREFVLDGFLGSQEFADLKAGFGV